MREIELGHAARRPAVAAHEWANEPPTQPPEIRPRGHKLNTVVHCLLVPSVVKPKPSVLSVRQVRLVAYGSVRTVLPLVGPPPRPARPRARNERLFAYQYGGGKDERALHRCLLRALPAT